MCQGPHLQEGGVWGEALHRLQQLRNMATCNKNNNNNYSTSTALARATPYCVGKIGMGMRIRLEMGKRMEKGLGVGMRKGMGDVPP